MFLVVNKIYTSVPVYVCTLNLVVCICVANKKKLRKVFTTISFSLILIHWICTRRKCINIFLSFWFFNLFLFIFLLWEFSSFFFFFILFVSFQYQKWTFYFVDLSYSFWGIECFGKKLSIFSLYTLDYYKNGHDFDFCTYIVHIVFIELCCYVLCYIFYDLLPK